MERCALQLLLPSASSSVVLPPSSPNSDTALQVWHVETETPRGLDFHRLSWRSRPARGALLASWIVRENATLESEVFRCPSGSFQAFEIGCAGRGCRTDFRQTPKRKDLGAYRLRSRTRTWLPGFWFFRSIWGGPVGLLFVFRCFGCFRALVRLRLLLGIICRTI